MNNHNRPAWHEPDYPYNAIWCNGVKVPSIKKANRVSYVFIVGGNFQTGFVYKKVTAPVLAGGKANFKKAVERCLEQADECDHVFIERFHYNETDKTWQVFLGS